MSVGRASLAAASTTTNSQSPQPASLFFCDGCQEKIPASKARIHCQSCQDFDLCANCFVVGVTAGSHASHHPTAVIKQSGTPAPISPSGPHQTSYIQPQPGLLPNGNTSLDQRTPLHTRPVSVNLQHQTTSPTIQQHVSPSPRISQSSFPPPPQSLAATNAQTTYQAYQPPPPPPPRQTPPAPSSPQSGSWQPLFNGNLASPFFVTLLNDIFNHLDPRRTGYLTPEVYSNWLDVQGYTLEHNVWKKCLTPAFGQNKEDMADAEWKSSLDNFSIEHIMAPRQQAPNNDVNNLVAGMNNVYLNSPGVQQILQMSKPRSVSGGQMPLLTRKGFIDITTVEVLYDPSAGWGNLNRALRTYSIWQGKGPIPREMLPAYPPQAILDQVKRISEMARYKAQQQVYAKQAELRLKQQGQQAALDLLDDRRYYYYP